jgi:hypothetical protein
VATPSESRADRSTAVPGRDPRRNAWILSVLGAVFLGMAVTLLLFLLAERRRAAAGEYRGLERHFEAQGFEAADDGSGRAALRPRSAARAEGSTPQPLPSGG